LRNALKRSGYSDEEIAKYEKKFEDEARQNPPSSNEIDKRIKDFVERLPPPETEPLPKPSDKCGKDNPEPDDGEKPKPDGKKEHKDGKKEDKPPLKKEDKPPLKKEPKDQNVDIRKQKEEELQKLNDKAVQLGLLVGKDLARQKELINQLRRPTPGISDERRAPAWSGVSRRRGPAAVPGLGAELPQRYGVELHAFVLMDNHDHLLLGQGTPT